MLAVSLAIIKHIIITLLLFLKFILHLHFYSRWNLFVEDRKDFCL